MPHDTCDHWPGYPPPDAHQLVAAPDDRGSCVLADCEYRDVVHEHHVGAVILPTPHDETLIVWPRDDNLADELANRLAWSQWLERHGLNPHDTPRDAVLVIDHVLRTMTAPSFHRRADGEVHPNPERTTACRVPTTVQLESQPLPWPTRPARHDPRTTDR